VSELEDGMPRRWTSWTEEERVRARAERRQAGEGRHLRRRLDAIAETVLHVFDPTPRLSAFMVASSSGVSA